MNVFKDRCFEYLKIVGSWCNIATVAKIFFMARAVNFLLADLTWVWIELYIICIYASSSRYTIRIKANHSSPSLFPFSPFSPAEDWTQDLVCAKQTAFHAAILNFTKKNISEGCTWQLFFIYFIQVYALSSGLLIAWYWACICLSLCFKVWWTSLLTLWRGIVPPQWSWGFLFWFLRFILFHAYGNSACMYVCKCVCMYTMCVPCACGGQKKASNPLELNLETVVSHHVAAGNWTWVF